MSQQFEFEKNGVAINSLTLNDADFDSNTVRARVKSTDGKTAYTSWVTLSNNANKDDNWSLSTLDLIIPDTETNASGLQSVQEAKLDVNIQGSYVDRDGTVTSDTYDHTWSTRIQVEQGLA